MPSIETILTELEIKLLNLLTVGMQAKEIATFWDTKTVDVQNSVIQLRHKLGAKNTAHLISIAYQQGILKIREPEKVLAEEEEQFGEEKAWLSALS